LHAQIEILASLQTVDREIKEQTGRKQRLLDELRVTEKQIQSKKGEIDALNAIYVEREKARVEKDRIFQDEGKKAMDKRMRMNRIKNTKELQALQREIELMRQTNGDLEEDLIRIMQEIDAVKAQIQTKQSEMAAIQEEWHKTRRAAGGDQWHRRGRLRSGHTPAEHRIAGHR
jgi:predicted  nucleic acid-binding Zn-ribbon protein